MASLLVSLGYAGSGGGMGCPWGPGTPVGIGDFCEAIHPCAWVLQPGGAASALAFVPVAIVIVLLARSREIRALNLLSVSAIAMAVGTLAQHATGTWAGMVADHAGMQLCNVVMVVLGLRRWRGWPWPALLVGGFLAWVAVTVGVAAHDEVRRALFVVGAAPCAMLEAGLAWRDGATIGYGWLAVGWGLFLVAIGAWAADGTAWGCDPEGLLQLHAGWHVLSALALGAWARHYAQFPSLRGHTSRI